MKRFEKIIPVYLGSVKIPPGAMVYTVYSAIVRGLHSVTSVATHLLFSVALGKTSLQALVSSTVK